jgi:hypothetical protein
MIISNNISQLIRYDRCIRGELLVWLLSFVFDSFCFISFVDLNHETFILFVRQQKTIYEHATAMRNGSFPAGPDVYRSINYCRTGDVLHPFTIKPSS